MLHGAAITGDKEMLQKLLKSSYFDKSAIDIRHCVIFFRLLCPLKNQNYPDHGQRTSRESFFSKIRNFWAWADKLG